MNDPKGGPLIYRMCKGFRSIRQFIISESQKDWRSGVFGVESGHFSHLSYIVECFS